MHPEQAVIRVRRLIDESSELAFDALDAWKERARLAVGSIYGDPSGQLERFDEIRWSLGAWSTSTPDSAFRDAKFRGMRRTVAMLQAVVEDLEEKGAAPRLPGIDPRQMHPWVADPAAGLWRDGHRQQAVQAAATAVETWLRAKAQVHQGSSASLVASLFAPTDSSPGSPRLRFRDLGPVGSDGWKSAHEGAGAFGRGCMLRIRNRYTHHTGSNAEEDLEALAALSLLARWIDEAELVE